MQRFLFWPKSRKLLFNNLSILWNIKILVISFCQESPQMLRAKFGANRLNCLGGVRKKVCDILRICWINSRNGRGPNNILECRLQSLISLFLFSGCYILWSINVMMRVFIWTKFLNKWIQNTIHSSASSLFLLKTTVWCRKNWWRDTSPHSPSSQLCYKERRMRHQNGCFTHTWTMDD